MKDRELIRQLVDIIAERRRASEVLVVLYSNDPDLQDLVDTQVWRADGVMAAAVAGEPDCVVLTARADRKRP